MSDPRARRASGARPAVQASAATTRAGEREMPEITDGYMLEMLPRSREYTSVLLTRGPRYGEDGSDKIIWEHGRRNFSLRAEGVLNIVCPVTDDSTLCGLGVFNTSVEEAVTIMEGDPGVQAGIFEYEVHPVRGFPGDALQG